MVLRTGVDLIYLPTFEKKLKSKGVLERMFHPSEQKQTAEHLAGIAAVKEAFFKAIDHKIQWLDVEVDHKKTGKPVLHVAEHYAKEIADLDVSIAHDHKYIVATVIVDWQGEL
jgi:phosphopantetheine--protein transferase-like protein